MLGTIHNSFEETYKYGRLLTLPYLPTYSSSSQQISTVYTQSQTQPNPKFNMKLTALAALILAIGTTALPVPPSIQSRATSASPYTTTQILQLALTLEHLESAF